MQKPTKNEFTDIKFSAQKKNEKTRIITGLVILGIVALLVLQKLEIIHVANLFTLLLTILFGGVFLRSIIRFDLDGFLFSGVLLINLYKENLGLHNWSIWYLLGIALLLDIALSLLLKPWLRKKRGFISNWSAEEEKSSDFKSTTEDGEEIYMNLKIGDATRYIKSDNFRSALVKMWIGEVKLFFEEAVMVENGQVWIEGIIGEVELYIPKEWQVVNQMTITTGSITEKGSGNKMGPTLFLGGHLKVGELTIHYV